MSLSNALLQNQSQYADICHTWEHHVPDFGCIASDSTRNGSDVHSIVMLRLRQDEFHDLLLEGGEMRELIMVHRAGRLCCVCRRAGGLRA